RPREALRLAEETAADSGFANESAADRAESLYLLGNLRRKLAQHADAEQPLLESLSVVRAAGGDQDPRYARGLHALAEFYKETAKYAQADQLFRKALALRRTTLGPDHPDIAETLHELAELCDLTNRMSEAESLA